jgi:hypothetical protein
MLKKYKSKLSSLRIIIKAGDNIIPVEFEWDVISNVGARGCSFSTDNVELQKAIEQHEYFGRKMQPNFWTDDKEEVVEVKEEVQEEPKRVKRYKNKD